MGDISGPTPIGGVVETVTLSSSDLTLGVGATVTLQAVARDRDGATISDRVVTWSSSDSTIVRVSPAGVLTGISNGTAQVAVSVAGKSALAQVRVIPRPVSTIELGPLAPRILVGGFVQLVALPRDETGAPLPQRTVFWSSSNATVATVDAAGFVSGLSPGAATITARSESREAAVGVTVSAVPVRSVLVSPRVDTIVVGQSTQLTAIARDSNTVPLVDRVFAWRSENLGRATVSATGLVLGVSPGTVTIVAQTDDVVGTATVVVQPRPIGAVIISPAQATLSVGTTVTVTVQITDGNGNLLTGRPVSFSSENASIATVTSAGVVRAVAVGTTNIRATSEGQTGLMSVTVTPTPVASVRITPSSSSLIVGDSVRLTAAALDAGGNVLSQRPVTWTSGAPSVLSVSSTGLVRALGAGTGLVFAVIDGRVASATVVVASVPVGEVVVTPASANLVVNTTLDLTAVARDASGTVIDKPVLWSSADPLIALVSSTGRVRGVSVGTTRIEATVDGRTGASTITVVPIPVASISLTLTDSSLNVGQTAQGAVVLRDATGTILTGRPVTWSSSAPLVATVNASGLVTAVNGGAANIIATSGTVSASVNVVVSAVVGSLSMQVQPAGAVSGQIFATQPVVRILDANGNVVATGPSSVLPITVTRASGSASLGGTTTVTAVNGVATFTNLSFTGAGIGAHTLRFSTVSPALEVTSASFNVAPGAATAMTAASSLSQSAAAGSLVSAPPSVRVSDASGNPVSGVSVTFTVLSGGGTITPASVATVVTNASGIAALSQWRLGVVAGANSVRATAAGLTGSPITFSGTGTVGTPTQLAIVTQPAGAISGRTLATQPVVEIRDAAGNRVTGATDAVTVSVATGTGTVAGTTTVNAVNGVATFTNVRINGAGAHTLQFAAAGLTAATSGTLSVTQVAASLAIATQPAGAASGAAFTTQPVVRILDDAGLVVTSGSGATLSVVASIATGTGTLGGTATVNAVNGVATFNNLSLTGSGAHTLRFSTTSPALAIVSGSISVGPGAPATIAAVSAVTQSATVLTAVGAPPSVRVTDASGNPVSGVAVTFAVTAGGGVIAPANGVVSTNASGVATLTSWTLGATLGANSVSATAAGLSGSPVVFNATGTVGAAATIIATTSTSQSATVSSTVGAAPAVRVNDAGGNPVSGVNVTFAVTAGGGSTSPASGATVATNASGVAALTSWTLGATPGTNSVTATAAGLSGSPVTFSATGTVGAATQLAMITQPAGATSGVTFTTQPVVEIRDALGNRVLGATNAVTAQIANGSGTLVGTVTVNAVNGRATFTNLRVNGSGQHRIRFTAAGLSNVTSGNFPVAQRAAALNLSTQPAGIVSGAAFATQPVVEVLDDAGLLVTTGADATVSVATSIASGTGVLAGTTTVNASGGVATFTNLAISGTGAHTLQFSVATRSLTVVSQSVVVGAPPATTIAANSSVSQSASVNSNVAAPPSVLVTDANNNPVSGVNVTFTVTAGGGGTSPASGAVIATNASGIASLTSWTLGAAPGANTVTATAAGLTGSPVIFNSTGIALGATQLAIVTQFTGAVSGVSFVTQPVVEVRDANGAVVAGSSAAVTASLASGSGALAGTVTVNAVNGVATFTNLRINGSGAHTLQFTSTGLTAATSNSVNVTQVPAALAIQTQPSGAVSGTAFTTQPVIRILDNAGLPVVSGSGATLNVTATRVAGTATLGGVTTVQAVNGIATFTNLAFGGTGVGAHSLDFATSSPSLNIVSANFTVSAGPAANIVANSSTTQSAAAGGAVAAAPSVRVSDSNNNPVAGVSVTFAVTAGGGTTTPASGAVVVTNASGLAALTSWTLGAAPGVNTVTATAAGLIGTPVVFSATGTAAAATQLGITTQPSGAVSGVNLTTQPVIEVRDANGDRVTTSTAAVTATIVSGNGALLGTATVNAVAGVATFSTLRVNGSGDQQLQFASPGLTAATSNTFVVTQVPASLAVQTQPSGAVSGAAFTTQPVVRILDNAGLVVVSGSGATLNVSAARMAGTATLSGTLTVAAVNGVATFTNLVFTGAGTGTHSIDFSTSAPALSVMSANFTVSAGPAAAIAAASVVNQSAAAGSPVAAPPSVRVADSNNNPVSGVAVTFAVASGGGTIVPASGAVNTNASGVATLTSWTLGAAAGANSVTATAAGLTGSPVTFNATGTAAAATQLGITTQPGGAVSGVNLTTQPVVEIRDANGDRVTTSTAAVTATVSSGNGVLVGTATVNAVAGVATFTTLRVNGSGNQQLQFTAAGLTAATSSTFAVTQVPASLSVLTQPNGAVSGAAFTTQPVVRILDNAGLVVVSGSGATLNVSAARMAGTATLSGVLTVAAVNGVATFTNLSFGGTGVGAHSLDFTTSAPALSVTSANFNVSAGAAATIAAVSSTTQSAPAGSAVTAPPSVRVSDSNNNPVSGVAVTFAVASGAGSIAPANGAVNTNASGIATLTSWTLGAAAGANSVTATAAGLTGSPITFNATGTAAAATQLGITTQPTGAVSGVNLTTQPVVEVRDANGDRVTTSTAAVTATITTGTGSLVGTATVNAVAGVATFTNLRINGAGDHQLQFTAAGLTAATSNTIAVTQVAASLSVQTQPSGAVNGVVFTGQPVVRILDNANLLIQTGAAATLNVQAARASGTATLTGTLTQAAVGGIATFDDLLLTGTAGAHTLSFTTATPSLNVSSASFALAAGSAANIVATSSTTQSATAGTNVAAAPSVRVTDASNNVVAGVNVTFAVASGGGSTNPASGAVIETNASGIAALTSWTLGGTPGANSVTATAAGLTGSPVTFNATGQALPATQLGVLTQPAGAVSGVAFTTQPVIEIRSANGDRVTTSTVAVTVTRTNGNGVLVGTETVNAVAGVATFTNLQLNGSGSNTLRFTSGALTAVSSNAFNVSQVAASLSIQSQPTTAVSGTAFSSQPVIRILDNAGLLVETGAGATLTVTAARAAGTASLGGTLTAVAVGGIASFGNLSFTGTVGAHTIQFTTTTPALTVTSGNITVSAGAATTIAAVSAAPQDAPVGTNVAIAPSVRVTDASGNPVAGVNVTFTLTGGGGTINSASTAVIATNASGIAALTSWTVGAAPGVNTVEATAAGLTGSPVVFTANGTALEPLAVARVPFVGTFTAPLTAQFTAPFTSPFTSTVTAPRRASRALRETVEP
jgi:uncharacterized protein YjdB